MSATTDTIFGAGKTRSRAERIAALYDAAKQRILILDGAMGTQIHALALTTLTPEEWERLRAELEPR